MAVQTEAGQATGLMKIKDWLTLASVIVVVVGGIAGGLLGGMKLVIAPLHADIRAIHGRLDRMDGRLGRMDGRMDQMDSRMQRLETGMTELRERLIRVETLLEQDRGRPDASNPQP